MAGIGKIKSASLIEVLVSISILATVMVVGTMVFVQVTSSAFTGQKIKAELVASQMFRETQTSKSFFDEEKESENLLIRKTVGKYTNSESLLTITIKVFNSAQKLLYERKDIILGDEKN